MHIYTKGPKKREEEEKTSGVCAGCDQRTQMKTERKRDLHTADKSAWRWMDGRMDGRDGSDATKRKMDGWMDGWMDGRMDRPA